MLFRAWARLLVVVPIVGFVGCGAADSSPSAYRRGAGTEVPSMDDLQDEVDASTVHVHFAPAPSGSLKFGSVPFPDDLYRDASGKLAFDGLWETDAKGAWVEGLNEGLSELDGFGLQGPVFFELDGDIDPASLPADAQASLANKASVFVLDVDTNSAGTFARVPVEVSWETETRRLVVIPAAGRVFAPGRKYAAVVTRAVHDSDKEAVGASLDFLRVRYADFPLDDLRLQQARQSYEPILDALEQRDVAREEIVALAAFRVQSVLPEMQEALAVVLAGTADGPLVTSRVSGTDLDTLLGSSVADLSVMDAGNTGSGIGAVHANMSELIQGTLSTSQLESETALVHGAFERDLSGVLMVKRVEDVPFTLILPRDAAADTPVPVVLFVHGSGGDRSDAVLVADRFAAAGMAVLALDSPFHGQRAGLGDMNNRFTGESTPDGFGDGSLDFYGMEDGAGRLVKGHPFYFRDAVRQAALDILYFLHVAQAGSAELTDVPLDFSRVALLGVDDGATVAMIVAALDERVELVTAVFAGGPLLADWAHSPAQSERVDELFKWFGGKARDDHAERRADMSVYQTLLDRADPLAWASVLQSSPVNMLLLMAQGDEVVSNSATEALGFVLGAAALASAEDVTLVEGVTRDLVDLGPATHGALYFASDSRFYSSSPGLPYSSLTTPVSVQNPVAVAQDYVVRFVESWRACITSSAGGAPCGAQVPAAL